MLKHEEAGSVAVTLVSVSK